MTEDAKDALAQVERIEALPIDPNQLNPAAIGRQIADDLKRRVEQLAKAWGCEPLEALKRHISGPGTWDESAWREQGLKDCRQLVAEEPDKLEWRDINILMEADAEEGWRALDKVVSLARMNRATGDTASEAVVTEMCGLQEKARFDGIRSELRSSWKPQPGLESILIDTMAQCLYLSELWMARHAHDLMHPPSHKYTHDERALRESGQKITPRLTLAEAFELSAGMCERWNKMFVRVARQLVQLRRYTIVVNGGLVNMAQQQQVNIGAGGGLERNDFE